MITSHENREYNIMTYTTWPLKPGNHVNITRKTQGIIFSPYVIMVMLLRCFSVIVKPVKWVKPWSWLAQSCRSLSWFLQHEVAKSISTPPGWDTSPLHVTPLLFARFPSNLPVPTYILGWREALWESGVLPKNTTQCPLLAWTQTTWSGEDCNNLEATAPPGHVICHARIKLTLQT